MSKWNLTYNSKHKFEKWLDRLTDEQLISISKELKLLELFGNDLKMPHSKALRGGIFELRERKFGFRIYYTFYLNNIVLLTAGNKARGQKDIIKALKISNEVRDGKI